MGLHSGPNGDEASPGGEATSSRDERTDLRMCGRCAKAFVLPGWGWNWREVLRQPMQHSIRTFVGLAKLD